MTVQPATASYDLFISYTEEDRPWVDGFLLDALEQAGARYQSEDAFALGVPRLVEFERAIKQSTRTLLVLSPAYLADTFGQFVDVLVNSYGMETATWPVIPLILQPVGLPARLSQLVALDATTSEGQQAALARLCAEIKRPLPGPAPLPDCPYPGMVPFDEADSARFFGREAEIQDLQERLRLHPFLAVIGASGSGKSSLVRAGLLPALRKSRLFGPGGWLIRTMRPGETPLDSLAAALGSAPPTPPPAPPAADDLLSALLMSAGNGGTVAPAADTAQNGKPTRLSSDGFLADVTQASQALLAAQPDTRRLLLVVDQFEETFTVARQDALPFQQALLQLAATPDCYVALTVRADFYADLMASPLWSEIQAHRVEVTPLSEAGLRRAIVQPAERVGVAIEGGLVERLAADAAGEPGVLPLVQETLVLLWERLERRFLPLRAYEALVLSRSAYVDGDEHTGLQVAIARRADATMASLTEAQQPIARRIFLRLVQFGEGRADTRRQQPLEALRSAGDDGALFDATLQRLAESRLLTLSGAEGNGQRTTDNGQRTTRRVDISHEALIRGWPTLQGWLKERRAGEQTRRRLEDKAREWVRLGGGNGGLLDEVELLEAERWLESPDADEMGFDAALPELVVWSRAAIEAAEQAKEEARQRELAQAQALAEEQKRRAEEQAAGSKRLRLGAMALLVALALTIGLGILSYIKELEAKSEARRASASELAAQAKSELDLHPQLSLLLAIESLRATASFDESRVPATEQILRDALARIGGSGLSGSDFTSIAVSPDGRLATGSKDGSIRLWDLNATGELSRSLLLPAREGEIKNLIFSPDAHYLIGFGTNAIARLWGLKAPDPSAGSYELPRQDAADGPTIGFSPDRRYLAASDGNNRVQLWDLSASLSAAPRDLPGASAPVMFSPDGKLLVTGGKSTPLQLWDLSARLPAAPRDLPEASVPVMFSPDGKRLIAAHDRDAMWQWDIADGIVAATPRPLPAHEVAHNSQLWFSPNGRYLVIGSLTGTKAPELWDLSAANPAANMRILGEQNISRQVVFSPDSRYLFVSTYDVTGAERGATRLWDLEAEPSAANPRVLLGGSTAAIFNHDSTLLATGDATGAMHLWNLTAPDPTIASRILHGHDGVIKQIVFSADEQRLVTRGEDGSVRLWNLAALALSTSPRILHYGNQPSTTANGTSADTLASPDRRWLAVGSASGDTWLWDVSAGLAAAPRVIAKGGVPVQFSPDSKHLSTRGDESTLRVWNIAPTAPINLLTVAKAGGDTAFSSDGRWLATSDFSDTVQLWDLTSANPASHSRVLPKAGHSLIRFSQDGGHVLTWTWDGTARIWDLHAPDQSPLSQSAHGIAPDWAHVISPDRRWLFISNRDGGAQLWDLSATDASSTTLALSVEGAAAIKIGVFSPDSGRLATGSEDGVVRVWKIGSAGPDSKPLVLHGHSDQINMVVFSPDGRRLVSVSADQTARIWDLSAADPAADPLILRGHAKGITLAAFSSDAKYLITASEDDHAVRIWNLRASDPSADSVSLILTNVTEDRPLSSEDEPEALRSITLDPDNQYIVVAGQENVWSWPLNVEDLSDLACRAAVRNLTWDEWQRFMGKEVYRQTCPKLPPHATYITHFLDNAAALALRGNIGDAIAAYSDTKRLDPEYVIDAKHWNKLCRYGSFRGYVKDVLPSCGQAVALAPNNAEYRDSRGLARALTGDPTGAIEDFEAFLSWANQQDSESKDAITLREQWIADLRAGRNPIDDAALKALSEQEQ